MCIPTKSSVLSTKSSPPSHIDSLLRGTGPFAPAARTGPPPRLLPAIILVSAPIYGAVMGTYALDAPERLLQVLYLALKLPLLLTATTLLCLPGFFVLTTILGLRDDLPASVRAILAGQAAMAVALAALPRSPFSSISPLPTTAPSSSSTAPSSRSPAPPPSSSSAATTGL